MKTRFITSKDNEAFGHFATHLFGRFTVIPPPMLYHYTTGSNLISIMNSEELWATHVSCLNDSKEILYSVEEIRKRINARRETNANSDVEYLLNRMDSVLSSPRIEILPLFVTCLSEKPDDLSQWRAYGGNEGGYAIGFDSARLRESTIAVGANPLLLRAEYDPDVHKILLDDIFNWAEKFYLGFEGRAAAPSLEEWTSEFLDYFVEHISYIVACIKHPKFKDEAEWRLVYTLTPADTGKLVFRQKTTMMTRHIPLPLLKPLPIAEAWIGPSRYPEISRIAVGDLLLSKGFGPTKTPVKLTDVPYRV